MALSADKVRGLKNSETVRSFADTLSVAPRRLHMCRDNVVFVIFCFAKPCRSVLRAFRWGAVGDEQAVTLKTSGRRVRVRSGRTQRAERQLIQEDRTNRRATRLRFDLKVMTHIGRRGPLRFDTNSLAD
jgi:hypothetical protein